MSSIIKVENLSKRFIISHEGGGERYTALRDVMARNAKKLFSFPKHLSTSNLTSTSKEEFWALKDLNFEIQQGDRVGIIGRNGAGKSTLLKILSRITEPSSGKITLKGRVASLLEVGTGFHPELTGRENIFLNGAILGMSRAEIKKKFDEIVDFAEVEKFLDTPVKRYSSGMYVRLAFAVAAHLEPEILVVDEVLAVGDTQFQKKCLGKMEDVSKNEGRTVLFVSHNMLAIKTLTNNSILMQKGSIQVYGTTTSVISTYFENQKQLTDISGGDLSIYRREKSIIDKKIYFSNIKVNNMLSAFPVIKSGSLLKIEFEVISAFADHDIVLDLTFKDSDGVPILTLCSFDFDKTFRLKAGKNNLGIQIPKVPLTEGSYYLNAGMNVSAEGIAFDVLIDLPVFQVVEQEKTYWKLRPKSVFTINENLNWLEG